MRIAVIGNGNIGGTLGSGWARAGHEVVFGTRAPQSGVKQLPQADEQPRRPTVSDAVAAADVVVLAVPWGAVIDVLEHIRPSLSGKILIDCTNPTNNRVGTDQSIGSGGEQVARLAPGARVVKAFNTTGFENLQNPRYGSETITMLYAGDDPEAKKLVHGLAADLGFDPVDAGALTECRALETIALLWIGLAHRQKMGRGIAFRLMRR